MAAKATMGRPLGDPRRGWVFVSYAHDDEERVRPIVEYLESQDFLVWWDDLIEPGDEWSMVLTNKLEDAACVVVVWSRSSVRSTWVRSEARRTAQLDTARGTGRLVPVLLDQEAGARIPLPFNEFEYLDLTSGQARRPLRKLASVVRGLVNRPPNSEERSGDTLDNDYGLAGARRASTEMRELSKRVGSIGELLVHDVDAARDVRAALDEVHKTLDVVTDSVQEFVAAGVTQDGLDARPYVRFERGALSRRIRDGRGHCDLIAIHYGRKRGLRSWLQGNASKQVLSRADKVFGRLSEADDDLFRELARIGDILTNESRVVVNLITANQPEAARRRVLDGRKRLTPLEQDLDKSSEVLQTIERGLGFARDG